jgi:hypothetical protein
MASNPQAGGMRLIVRVVLAGSRTANSRVRHPYAEVVSGAQRLTGPAVCRAKDATRRSECSAVPITHVPGRNMRSTVQSSLVGIRLCARQIGSGHNGR